MALPVSRPLFEDIALMTASFKEIMVTMKGPIAPRLTDEQIALIFGYGKEHFSEMLAKEDGMYHQRPSETGLRRSITWIKEGCEIDFIVHCNKLNPITGGDQPLSESATGVEKKLSYAFSSLMRMIYVSAGVQCIVSDKMDLAFSSKRLAYALDLQHKCSEEGVAYITNSTAYQMKKKSRVVPSWFSARPTFKFRFFMYRAECDLFDANPVSLPLTKKINIILSLLQSIRHLHDHDVAHCDIKPENYLIFEDVENLELTDFGSAVKKEDFDLHINRRFTLLYNDPESMTAEPDSFEALKALDIWQAALTISYILNEHAVNGLFSGFYHTPTKPQLLAMFSTLAPDWYSKKYSASLKEIYRPYPEIVGPLIELLNRMLHLKNRERPSIHECIAIIESLMPKPQLAESTSKT